MLPAINEPVHLIDDEGHQSPGVVVLAQRHEPIAVRIDAGPSAALGALMALTWSIGPDVFQVEVMVIDRRVVDGVPAVGLEPRGPITKIQRRRYVRVPVQRPILVEVDPVPIGEPAGRATGLTLDIAEASLACSLSERHAETFCNGTQVRVTFELDGIDYVLAGTVAQVRRVRDADKPRVEFVVMLEVTESERTAIRRALFAEQIRMRTLG